MWRNYAVQVLYNDARIYFFVYLPKKLFAFVVRAMRRANDCNGRLKVYRDALQNLTLHLLKAQQHAARYMLCMHTASAAVEIMASTLSPVHAKCTLTRVDVWSV